MEQGKINALRRQFYALLSILGMQKYKEDLCLSFSDGRATRTSDLETEELQSLVDHLIKIEVSRKGDINKRRCDKLRKVLIAMSYNIGENTEFVIRWCEKYGVFGKKKAFNDYSAHELKGLIEKFKRVQHHRIHAVDQHLRPLKTPN